jgi:hypothetical protein
MHLGFVSETLWWREHVEDVNVDGYDTDTHLWIMCELNLIESEQGKLTVNINPFQSNFSATRILPSAYLFWAGKRLVDYL